MLSDIAVLSERATFRGPELLRGVADMFYAAITPAHIGIARTRKLMFSGRGIDAAEAPSWSLTPLRRAAAGTATATAGR